METQIAARRAKPSNATVVCLAVALGSGTAGCMRETVRDSHGNLIYQETVHGSLSESDQERANRVLERESELGY